MTDVKYTDLMKPEQISIETLWRLMAKFTVPPDASREQHDTMRNCFYAGWIECFKVINDLSTELPEDQAGAHLSRLSIEANAFMASIRLGLPQT